MNKDYKENVEKTDSEKKRIFAILFGGRMNARLQFTLV